ncbi:MAG: ankyrin repeat domain-containing protein [Candidatus Endonucleobacter bathymodioli]|uniref:Ankyrin repeat domain-containing protein n=1 Tax=Candidatus Endonucleibacter bathymodioli TaxID=539814 RepID=A0AA90NNA6_9GAMM|nr:ankyrin repeat domain-containing protein [Candidatus Endonucleobacter bathymodioli]
MFCALLKSSTRLCHLIDVLLFCSIVTGIYSGVCCAVLRIDSNSFDGASVIDSVDESNSIVHDGDVQDDSSTYKDCSVLSIVSDMDDSDLLNAMQCLLNIAKKHNDDGLIKALQLSEMSNYASKENDVTALQGADLNHDYVIKFLRDNIHTAPYESEGGLLTCAIPFGNNKLIELLIESGTKVNIPDANQYIPLHNAVMSGEIEIVKILLNASADINHKCLSIHILHNTDSIKSTVRDIIGKFITPLRIAILFDNFYMVKVLLDKKANPNDCIENQFTPLGMAVTADTANSNNIVTELLLAGAEMNTQNDWNCNMLQYAVSISSNLEVLKTIIVNGATNSIDNEASFGCTPLSLAIINESSDSVKVLINNGANPNYIHMNLGMNGDMPLHIAAQRASEWINKGRIIDRNTVDIFEILISEGADVNCLNLYGLTPLMTVVKKPRHLDKNNDTIDTIKLIISMLLRNGADINIIDKKGNTALHYASKYGNYDFASLLLDYGSKRDIKNCDGFTVLDRAMSYKISMMISNTPVVTMQPTRMKTIVRNSIRSLLIKMRPADQSLSKMISKLELPKIIDDFLRNPI